MKRQPPGTYKTYRQTAKRQKTYAPRPQAYIPRAVAARPIPQDTKYFDTSFSQAVSSAADWTGSEVPCTNYLQSDGATVGAYTDSAFIPSAIGAGYGQVNNNKYFIKKLRVRGFLTSTITSDAADVPVPNNVRLTLVMDKQPNGAQAQGENVFTDMGTSFQAHHSFLAVAAGAGGRFQVLKDKFFTLQPAAAGTDGASTNSTVRTGVSFKFNCNFNKPLQVQLKANSAVPTVASLSNYNIFLLAHSIQAGGTPQIDGCARCYFTD